MKLTVIVNSEYKDGASIDPCDEDYQGPSAFSEPETRAVRDAVISRRNQIQAFITLHSYSEIWVHPWGFKKNYYPKDISELVRFSLIKLRSEKSECL